MKKIICLFLCCILLLGLTACAHEPSGEGDARGKLNIICTIFPQYDWTRQILGNEAENAELTMLLDNGVDLHSYQPTADDIVKVSGCDLFIYVGGESDAWVDDALKEAVNKNMIVLNLMDILGERAKAEETVEGMQAEEEEGEAGEEPEYDEHVWLSLRNASVFCDAIAGALATLDPGNAETYRANCEAYIEKLGALDAGYESAVQNAKLKTVLFADRFPFRYLADDYGLTYYAAFSAVPPKRRRALKPSYSSRGRRMNWGFPRCSSSRTRTGRSQRLLPPTSQTRIYRSSRWIRCSPSRARTRRAEKRISASCREILKRCAGRSAEKGGRAWRCLRVATFPSAMKEGLS